LTTVSGYGKSFAIKRISVPANAFDTGQFCFASRACLWNVASSSPGTSAVVSRSIRVMLKLSPTWVRVTVARVWIRVGAKGTTAWADAQRQLTRLLRVAVEKRIRGRGQVQPGLGRFLDG